MRSCKHNDEGFTGLEAAIVLIAFVVVAAVFSYVVLGAGFFTTQKAQQTVHTGVSQATSAVEPSGPVSVQADSSGTGIQNITFYLQLAAGGAAVDMSKVTFTVSTPTLVETYTNATVNYTWVQQNTPIDLGQTQHAGLLNAREMVLVAIDPSAFGSTNLGVNTAFVVQVNPPIGAALPIARTIPAGMTANNWYEVY
jgi:flagellin FlaB